LIISKWPIRLAFGHLSCILYSELKVDVRNLLKSIVLWVHELYVVIVYSKLKITTFDKQQRISSNTQSSTVMTLQRVSI